MSKTKILSFENSAMEELVAANEDIRTLLQKSYDYVTLNRDFSFDLKKVVPYVKGVIDSVKNSFEIDEIPQLDKDQTKFLSIVNEIPFSQLRNIRAFKPEGLKVTYLELLENLEKEVNYASTVNKDVLQPFVLQLAHLVSNDDSYKSLDTNEVNNKRLEDRRELAYNEFSKLYDKNSIEVSTTVGKVIDRNSDWQVLFVRLNKVLAALEAIDRDSIQKSVKICGEYIDIVVDKINDGKVEEVSPEALRALTNTTLQMAREIEALSVTYFRTLTLKGSVENTIQKIKEVYN